MEPPSAALFAWIFLGQQLAPVQLVGGTLVIAGEAGEQILSSTTLIGIVLLWMSAIFTIYTGWDYFRAGIHHLIKEDEG